MQIRSKALSYQYNQQQPALHFPDFDLPSASKLLVMGQSGVGKSTLLHLLGLLLQPTAGQLVFDNTNITTLNTNQTNTFRARHLGIIFQKPHFVQSLSVAENIVLPCFLAQKPVDRKYLEDTANNLNIKHLFKQKTYQLSLGEQQRVGILRTLLAKPALLLADEPTSSLDDQNCEQVLELLSAQSQLLGASLIIVTHDSRLKSKINNQLILS
jgi:lipoprotein-releasing system ATP-binding protein